MYKEYRIKASKGCNTAEISSAKSIQAMTNSVLICPCDSGLQYNLCCGRYHAGDSPPTAKMLMRSRYSAYVLKQEAYLLATWHPQTQPLKLNLELEQIKWLGLKIVATELGDLHDFEGIVEFIAGYKIRGRAQKIAEKSFFVRLEGRWFYKEGVIK